MIKMEIKMKNAVLGACVITGMMLAAPSSYAAVVGDGSTSNFVRITVENSAPQNANANGFCEVSRLGNSVTASIEATGMDGDGNVATAWVILNGSNIGRLDTAVVGAKGDASWEGGFTVADGDTLALKIRQHNTTVYDLGNAPFDAAADADLQSEGTTPGGVAGATKPGQCLYTF
jgi:hypothetical protein